ncbi:hypothetical protein L596_024474 [Steinernema carpocapsae]|uniref:Uncharacterized protein n=1 Tax=Steinernema carpocapsae TaxID=34508 RepID=A0A4U5MGV2_STECR|nr:hypothetical protein L596_024474 [Steinernema carpocapsae]
MAATRALRFSASQNALLPRWNCHASCRGILFGSVFTVCDLWLLTDTPGRVPKIFHEKGDFLAATASSSTVFHKCHN